MSAAKHTPGPWTMETVRTSSGVCFKVGPFPWKQERLNHACIYADYPGVGWEHGELVANARLIAVAPELLEALRDMLDGWKYIRQSHGDLYGVGWDRAQEKAETAIAKATGEAP